MHLITYISDCTGPGETIEYEMLKNIIATAKQENPKHDITGALFFMEGKFLQVIEGEEEPLRQLMQNIEADDRHKNLRYLIDTAVAERGFADWNMDSFVLDQRQTFDAPTLKDLSERFLQHLIPRSDTLVRYYKSLLAQKTH